MSHSFSEILIKDPTSSLYIKPELSLKKLRLELDGAVLWPFILGETELIELGGQLVQSLIGLITLVSHLCYNGRNVSKYAHSYMSIFTPGEST